MNLELIGSIAMQAKSFFLNVMLKALWRKGIIIAILINDQYLGEIVLLPRLFAIHCLSRNYNFAYFK